MVSISPLKAAAASGVWPRSFAISGSAPYSSSSFIDFGMAVVGGDHQQAVALIIAQVGPAVPGRDIRGTPRPVRPSRAGRPPRRKVKCLVVDLRLLIWHGNFPRFFCEEKNKRDGASAAPLPAPQNALQRAAARSASSNFSCGSGVSSTPWDSPNDAMAVRVFGPINPSAGPGS